MLKHAKKENKKEQNNTCLIFESNFLYHTCNWETSPCRQCKAPDANPQRDLGVTFLARSSIFMEPGRKFDKLPPHTGGIISFSVALSQPPNALSCAASEQPNQRFKRCHFLWVSSLQITRHDSLAFLLRATAGLGLVAQPQFPCMQNKTRRAKDVGSKVERCCFFKCSLGK